jgi:hypothetical protein
MHSGRMHADTLVCALVSASILLPPRFFPLSARKTRDPQP